MALSNLIDHKILNSILSSFFLGIDDISTLQIPAIKSENSPVMKHLKELYISSTTDIILSMLREDDGFLPWSEQDESLHQQNADEPSSLQVEEKSDKIDSGNGQSTKVDVDYVSCQSEGNGNERTLQTKSQREETHRSCFFNSKDNFWRALHAYLDFLNFNTSENVHERQKALHDISSLLQQRGTSVPSDFMTRISQIK